jgi:hypothetical protein
MSSLLGNIDTIREELFLERFTKELESMKLLPDQPNENLVDEDLDYRNKRIKMLETIINAHKEKLKMAESSYKNQKSLNDDLNDISKLVFQKTWNKLPDYHKMEKIKEYITGLIKDPKLQKRIITDLNNMVISKKLTMKVVEYDSTNCVIKSIPVLKQNDKDGTYEIKN